MHVSIYIMYIRTVSIVNYLHYYNVDKNNLIKYILMFAL